MPEDRSLDWLYGWDCGRLDLIDLLLPVGTDVSRWLAEHHPDEIDAQLVEAHREGAGSVERLREAAFPESVVPKRFGCGPLRSRGVS